MLRRSRVSSTVDTARLGAALARPGMDPRVWVSLAYVVKLNVDPVHGPIVDIVLSPSQQQETARVGAEYAGKGWGIYAPVYPDDEVLVAAPSGDPDDGLVVIKRLWSAADTPPAEAVANPSDLLIHVQDGFNLRLITTGAGQILTGNNPTDAALMGSTFRNKQASLHSTMQTQLAALNAALTPLLLPPAAAAAKAAVLAMQTAISNFESFASSYLASSVKVGP